MHEIHLRELDLNLLVVLEELLREQSVTRAARRLGRTPSAVSHALARLRGRLGDDLLVPDGRRMRPTARGRSLAEGLPRVLDQLRRTLAPPEPFAPATSTRAFRLAAPDFVASLLPALLADLAAVAPGVSVELVGVGPGAARDLEEGRTDVLVAPATLDAASLRATPIGTFPWAVFGRRGHPAFADWGSAAWAAHPHLQVRTPGGAGEGPVDRAARALGLSRAVRVVVPHFAVAPAVLARTGLLFTAPRVAVAAAAAAHDLVDREVPFSLPPMAMSSYRSALAGDEPGVAWFLARVVAAFGEVRRAAER
jgi:DNA-binding transcriptional LysR family regulator